MCAFGTLSVIEGFSHIYNECSTYVMKLAEGVPEMRAIRRPSTEIPGEFDVFTAQWQQANSGLLITRTRDRFSNFQC